MDEMKRKRRQNVFLSTGILYAALVLLGGCNDAEIRQASKKAAIEWIQENRFDATVSCRYPNPYICDVVPKDPRPNIVLYCDGFCRLAIQ